jgi:hypothetical protein
LLLWLLMKNYRLQWLLLLGYKRLRIGQFLNMSSKVSWVDTCSGKIKV